MSGNIDSSNPNLLNPLSTTPNSVPSLPGITKPFPVVHRNFAEYYFCSMNNHHMFRTDGKRLVFMFKILETKDEYDIKYLEQEILDGNPFVRKATPTEIQEHGMRMDPRGTMTRELSPIIEEQVRQKLDIELRASFQAKLNTLGIVLSDEQLGALKKAEAEEVSSKMVNEGTYPATAVDIDTSKLAGSDVLSRLKAQFSGGVKSGTGTVFPTTPTLQGMVGSDKTTTGLAGSGTSPIVPTEPGL